MSRFSLAIITVLALATGLAAQSGQSKKTLKVVGTTHIGNAKSASTEVGNEVLNGPEVDVSTVKPQISGNVSPSRVPSAHVPSPAGNAVIGAGGSNSFSFDGLDH